MKNKRYYDLKDITRICMKKCRADIDKYGLAWWDVMDYLEILFADAKKYGLVREYRKIFTK